jgi:hypothetical protein
MPPIVEARPAGWCCGGVTRFEVRFDEFFLLVFRERTVDRMFVGFCSVGHSDFHFLVQIWLRGPTSVSSRVPCVRDREAAIL